MDESILSGSSNGDYSVCVGIPTRNRPNRLKRCLEKLKTQEYANFKLIVADSSRHNETEKVCKQYQKEFNSLIYIKHNKIGASAARNIISNSCEADLLLFLDDDVYLEKTCLSQLLSFYMELKDKENYLLAASVMFPNGLSLPGKLSPDGTGFPAKIGDADYLISALLLLPRKIYTSIAWNERLVHGYDDIFFSLNCKKAGFKLAFCDQILGIHDKEYTGQQPISPAEISHQAYTMTYKHIVVSLSLRNLLVLETYGFIRILLWYLQPHISNPALTLQVLTSYVTNWARGQYWFLHDLKNLISTN